MTAAALQPRHEPDEHEDPRNALLDVAADMIRRCVDLGCEAQIRARLASILPEPVKPAAGDGLPAEALPRAMVVSALREGRARIKADASKAMFDTALAVMAGDTEAVERRIAEAAANLTKRRAVNQGDKMHCGTHEPTANGASAAPAGAPQAREASR